MKVVLTRWERVLEARAPRPSHGGGSRLVAGSRFFLLRLEEAVAGCACYSAAMARYKLIIERHTDGFVAYPLGFKGIVVGQGDSFEAALNDVKSAIAFHLETFGPLLDEESSLAEAFVAEAEIA